MMDWTQEFERLEARLRAAQRRMPATMTNEAAWHCCFDLLESQSRMIHVFNMIAAVPESAADVLTSKRASDLLAGFRASVRAIEKEVQKQSQDE